MRPAVEEALAHIAFATFCAVCLMAWCAFAD